MNQSEITISQQDRESIDLRDFFRAVLRRKWMVAGIIVVGVAISLALAMTVKPLYRSIATVAITPPQLQLSESIVQNPAELTALARIFASSRMVITEVYKSSNIALPEDLSKLPSDLEIRVEGMQIILTAQHEKPEVAASLANTWSKLINDRINVITSDKSYKSDLKLRIDLKTNEEIVKLKDEYLKRMDFLYEVSKSKESSDVNKILNARTKADLAEQEYLKAMHVRTQVDFGASTEYSSKILEDATPSQKPFKGGRTLVFGIGICLSIFLSVLLCVTLEIFDDTVKTAKQVSRQFHTLNTVIIPHQKSVSGRNFQIVREFTNSKTTAAFTQFALQIYSEKSDSTTSKLVAICSPKIGTGGSSVCANLAITLAAMGQKVLVVDCNSDTASLSEHFKIDAGRSLLGGSAQETLVENKGYSVLPLRPQTDPLVPFKPEELESKLSQIQTRFDIVLIDCTPILHGSDADLLVKMSDCVVLVVRSRKTLVAECDRAILQIQNTKPIDLIVVNDEFGVDLIVDGLA